MTILEELVAAVEKTKEVNRKAIALIQYMMTKPEPSEPVDMAVLATLVEELTKSSDAMLQVIEPKPEVVEPTTEPEPVLTEVVEEVKVEEPIQYTPNNDSKYFI